MRAQEKLDHLTDQVEEELKDASRRELYERIASLRAANTNLHQRLERRSAVHKLQQEGLSNAEIAEKLGHSEGLIRSLLK